MTKFLSPLHCINRTDEPECDHCTGPGADQDFAGLTRTDLGSVPKRYLWTDAFAVCNYLGLFETTGDATYRELALRLIDQVHHTLGGHRGDEARTGWISGLSQRRRATPDRRGPEDRKIPARARDGRTV